MLETLLKIKFLLFLALIRDIDFGERSNRGAKVNLQCSQLRILLEFLASSNLIEQPTGIKLASCKLASYVFTEVVLGCVLRFK